MKHLIAFVLFLILAVVAAGTAQAQYAYPYQFGFYSSAPIGGYGPNLPANLYPPRSPYSYHEHPRYYHQHFRSYRPDRPRSYYYGGW